MSKCSFCGKDIPRGKSYIGTKYKSLKFCCEEHFNQYVKIKSQPKPPINFKPPLNSTRRKFTDYIQEWTDDNVNWPAIAKQAKDIQEEYELDWNEMYLVCKYAKLYEGHVWDLKYGLGQIFPKYIKPAKDFINAINKIKNTEIPEEETYVMKRKRNYIGKVDW